MLLPQIRCCMRPPPVGTERLIRQDKLDSSLLSRFPFFRMPLSTGPRRRVGELEFGNWSCKVNLMALTT
ncbi:hypothetical protein BCR43DRAFT_484934, partial [Syncephalastrum racemosum]